MSLEEQQVIALGYFEGLSSSEIAERVGAPVGTVKSQASKGLAKLRTCPGLSRMTPSGQGGNR